MIYTIFGDAGVRFHPPENEMIDQKLLMAGDFRIFTDQNSLMFKVCVNVLVGIIKDKVLVVH